jgi:hypothetical protein
MIRALALVILLVSCAAAAQESSDMSYVKPVDLNSSFVGKFVHLDFGNRSSFSGRRVRRGDTVEIKVKKDPVKFVELRFDDRSNAYFKEQYLETEKPINGINLRIARFQVKGVNHDKIKVRAYFDSYDLNGKLVENRSFTKDMSFRKSEIAEILVKKD